jgi:hypothetical protein
VGSEYLQAKMAEERKERLERKQGRGGEKEDISERAYGESRTRIYKKVKKQKKQRNTKKNGKTAREERIRKKRKKNRISDNKDKGYHSMQKNKNRDRKVKKSYKQVKDNSRKREYRKENRTQCIQTKGKVYGKVKLRLGGRDQKLTNQLHKRGRYNKMYKTSSMKEKYKNIEILKIVEKQREVAMQYRMARKHGVLWSTRRHIVQWHSYGKYKSETNTHITVLLTECSNKKEKSYSKKRIGSANTVCNSCSINSSTLLTIAKKGNSSENRNISSTITFRNFRLSQLVIFVNRARKDLKCHCEAVITVSVLLLYIVLSMILKRQFNLIVWRQTVTYAKFSLLLQRYYYMFYGKLMSYLVAKLFVLNVEFSNYIY